MPLWVRAGAIVPMGPDLAHTEERPLDPLTLELYLPTGEAHTVIHDEDKREIPVHYARQGDSLTVEVGACSGEVEIVLYGLQAAAASVDGRPLTMSETAGGQYVRFDGTRNTKTDLRLL